MSLTHPRMKPSKAKASAIRCIMAGLVPFIQSSPGMGKSSLAKEIADEGNLELIDIRLSQCAPEDLQGLPMKTTVNGREVSTFLPFDMFPIESTPLPKGKAGWLILFDEFNSDSKSVQSEDFRSVVDNYLVQ